MARMQLFEWEDQPWLAKDLRDIITDHLRHTFSAPRAANLRDTVVSILEAPLNRSGATRIVDVCSGGGGPLPSVLPLLAERSGRSLTATLTDLYPNAGAFQRIQREKSGKVQGELRSVSAFDVPKELGEFQTLFTAFHHFHPEDAKRILADVASKGRAVAIIEPFRRADFSLVTIGGFVRGLILTPMVGPMTLTRLLWTYPIPISPFVLAWDGAVSCLRAYTAVEMQKLGEQAAPHYRWTSGEKRIPGAPGRLAITYLIGEPINA
jgi:SAM-dependent methyltransferase